MTYWTILWITLLSGPLDGQKAYMVYPSMETCRKALTVISDTISYDHNMICEETPTMSTSLRPKRNPRYDT